MIGTNQYCTTAQAVDLKNKHQIIQKSIFYWYHNEKQNWELVFNPNPANLKQYPSLYFSAFTAQELRVMIPEVLVVDCIHFLLDEKKNYGGCYNLTYWQTLDNGNKHPFYSISDENECNARAKLLLELLLNKRVDVSELNKQLIKFHNSAE